jgi:hypothetical protein
LFLLKGELIEAASTASVVRKTQAKKEKPKKRNIINYTSIKAHIVLKNLSKGPKIDSFYIRYHKNHTYLSDYKKMINTYYFIFGFTITRERLYEIFGREIDEDDPPLVIEKIDLLGYTFSVHRSTHDHQKDDGTWDLDHWNPSHDVVIGIPTTTIDRETGSITVHSNASKITTSMEENEVSIDMKLPKKILEKVFRQKERVIEGSIHSLLIDHVKEHIDDFRVYSVTDDCECCS